MAKIEALIPPIIMAVLFVAVVRTIIASQNPARKAAARAREARAEQADPRFVSGGAAASAGVSGSDPSPESRRDPQ